MDLDWISFLFSLLVFFPLLPSLLSSYRSCLLERPPTENTIPLPMVLCCQDRERPLAWLRCTGTWTAQKPQSLIYKIKTIKKEPLTSEKNIKTVEFILMIKLYLKHSLGIITLVTNDFCFYCTVDLNHAKKNWDVLFKSCQWCCHFFSLSFCHCFFLNQ